MEPPNRLNLEDVLTFEGLPDEMLIQVCLRLDISSIGKLAQVSKRFRTLSGDDMAWRELSKLTPLADYIAPTEGIRNYFFESFRKKKEITDDNELEIQRALKEKKIKERASFLMLVACGKHYEWITAGCLISITALVASKLDGLFRWSWFFVLIPLYILALHIAYSSICYDVFSRRDQSAYEEEFAGSSLGPVYYSKFVPFLGCKASAQKRTFFYSFVGSIIFFCCHVYH